jgi:hypothetical protein
VIMKSARAHAQAAIALDPNFALAHGLVALLGAINANMSFVKDRLQANSAHCETPKQRSRLIRTRRSAWLCGLCSIGIGQFARGREWLERAIEIDPSNAQAHVAPGATQVQLRELEAGIKKDAAWNPAESTRC